MRQTAKDISHKTFMTFLIQGVQSRPSSQGIHCDTTFAIDPPTESDNITSSACHKGIPVFLTDGSPLSDWTYVFHGSTEETSVYSWKTYVSLTLPV